MKNAYNIDELLRQKPWQELVADEKAYALSLVESEAEYNALRQTMLLIDSNVREEEVLVPNPRIKENLLRQFETDGRTKVIWLNSVAAWLIPTEKKIYQMPIAQIAATVAIVFGTTLAFNAITELQNNDMMANNEFVPEEVSPQEDTSNDDALTTGTDQNGEAPLDEAHNMQEQNLAETTVAQDNSGNGLASGEFVADLENDLDSDNAEDSSPLFGFAATSGGVQVASTDVATNEATTSPSYNWNNDVTDTTVDGTSVADDPGTVVYSSNLFTTTTVSSKSADKDAIDLPDTGTSLGETSELIELLYSTL